MSDDGLRTFVGIPILGDAKAALLRLQERFRLGIHNQRAIKWERASNLHATVQFLGATPREELATIDGALRRASAGHSPFTLELAAPTTFGGPKPRILVVSTGAGSDRLEALQVDVARELTPLGFAPDSRPYHPHFTVGRVRRNKKLSRAEADSLIEKHAHVPRGAAMAVTELVLFESELTATGAVYSRLATIPL